MTVAELIEELQQFDEELEVRLMEQPGWPFEYSIKGVTDRHAIAAVEMEEGEASGDPGVEDKKSTNTVFILEGNQLCYGSGAAWMVL